MEQEGGCVHGFEGVSTKSSRVTAESCGGTAAHQCGTRFVGSTMRKKHEINKTARRETSGVIVVFSAGTQG